MGVAGSYKGGGPEPLGFSVQVARQGRGREEGGDRGAALEISRAGLADKKRVRVGINYFICPDLQRDGAGLEAVQLSSLVHVFLEVAGEAKVSEPGGEVGAGFHEKRRGDGQDQEH